MTLYERYRLAEAQLEAEQPIEAVATLAPAAGELADVAAAQLLLARALFASAQLGRARAVLERLVERDPTDAYARFLLGRVAERSGDRAAAAGHVRTAAALDPRPEYLDRLAELAA